VAYCFLALTAELQTWIFTSLPTGLAFTGSRCGGRCRRWCWPASWSR
jgi:hypothetical protein